MYCLSGSQRKNRVRLRLMIWVGLIPVDTEVAKCFNLRGCFYKFVIKAVENTLHCENVEMTCLLQLSSTKF